PDCLALRPETLGIAVTTPTKETGLFVRGLADDDIVARVAAVDDARRLVEKTPAHLLEAARIRRLFPAARLVLIRRDPHDVIYSMVQKNEFWATCPRTLPDALDLYLRYERAEPRAGDLADHAVDYAALWADPVGVLTGLCAALGLDPAPVPAIVEATRGGRSLPEALKGVFREGTPGQGRARFTPEQLAYIEARLDEARPVAAAPGAAPLRVLVATNHLFAFTGSELTAFTLARQLQAKGQRVTVWARHVARDFARVFTDAGLEVIASLAGLPDDAFDAAYVQHSLGALELRDRFPRLPFVQAALGVLPYLEQPAFLDLGVARHLAISEEVRDNLLAHGVPAARIAFLRNVVDGSRFRPLRPPADPPRRALVYSYKIGAERAALVAEACRRRGLACAWIGRRPGEIDQAALAERLNDADIVFALGRGAIETMLCGRVPFVFDCHGGDGPVTPATLDAIARCNFSGRLHGRSYSVEALAEALGGVRTADGAVLRGMALERFDAGQAADRLLGLLREAVRDAAARTDVAAPSLLRPVVRALAEARSYAEQAAALNAPAPAAPPAAAASPGAPGLARIQAVATAAPEPAAGAAGEPGPARVIAFYLPQFHPIPENDAWWGPGFTEWTNVARSRPAFPGHDQPRLPGELGFYDLRLPEVMAAQAALARAHGVDAFCHYHYWFGGRRLLETPVERMLASGRPDLPFCLCWANESWTRAWDGRSDEVLLAQTYGEDDDRAHARDLLRFFRDPRYLRVAGRPVFLVYRPSRLPDAARSAAVWREEAARAGLPGLYLCGVESFLEDRGDPAAWGFDAAVEFQPDWANLGEPLRNPAFGRHRVHDYADFVARQAAKPAPGWRRHPCVTPRWDNTARRPADSVVLLNAEPRLYGEWLATALAAQSALPPDARLVFVNAWNEWGEGCHLEPDLVAGRAWLEATREAVARAAAAPRAAVARALRLDTGFHADGRDRRWLGPEAKLRVTGGEAGGRGVRLWISCAELARYDAPRPALEVWAHGRKQGELAFDADWQTRDLLLRVSPPAEHVDVTLRATACLRDAAGVAQAAPLSFALVGEPA
ncbi:MAG: glycoside hydrolase family 99-like domain-containing protein, partial [Candidatus Krumholzibacteriia bacterium]